ncbi:hypothetical protein AAGS40_29790 (plasmid) [Paraburkholderia sp. PREW-6R]|uniref:hypothetical protein n=1 Tax=Paraburkholderia sp. PREW-6R TaxID=3141544 RepID=UPI0031F4BEDF
MWQAQRGCQGKYHHHYRHRKNPEKGAAMPSQQQRIDRIAIKTVHGCPGKRMATVFARYLSHPHVPVVLIYRAHCSQPDKFGNRYAEMRSNLHEKMSDA